MRRLVDAVVGLEHLARGGHRVMRSVIGLQRCAEQREKAVAEKLVHDAAMAVEDVDQDREGAVEAVDDFLRRALAGSRRSEEHTSELQSRPHLVCRLLLEKKKTSVKVL